MVDQQERITELKELTDEQFEDTSFWSQMLDEPDDPSFVERSDRTEGFLDDKELPVHTENTIKQSEENTHEKEEGERIQPRKRYLLIAIILSCLFISTGVVIYVVFFSGPSSAPRKEENPAPAEPTQEGTAVPTKEVEYINIQWEPFWLRLQKDGKEVFLTLSFTTTTSNPKVTQEIAHKEILLRDAIYYYLQNSTVSTNKEMIEKMKRDIIDIINSYITAGTIDSLGIESFFIQ